MAKAAKGQGSIRTGIGGWVYKPWRETFYPQEVKAADELRYAASRLRTIEINGTFYRTQSPQTFRQWHDETPDDFMFSVKAQRGAAQRKDPAEAAPSVERFLQSGLTELGPKLGPILWQLPAGRRFERDVMTAFLDLLPDRLDGIALRHVMEAEHPSFATEDALALLAERGVALAILDKGEQPPVGAVTAPFVYLRLQNTQDEEPAGYASAGLRRWAERLQDWAAGGSPDDLPSPVAAEKRPRDVFAYVIAGAKHRAPAAALALAERAGVSR